MPSSLDTFIPTPNVNKGMKGSVLARMVVTEDLQIRGQWPHLGLLTPVEEEEAGLQNAPQLSPALQGPAHLAVRIGRLGE